MSSGHLREQLIWLMLCLHTFAGCQRRDSDSVEVGRQLIQDLYKNFSVATPLSNPIDLIFVLDRSASVGMSGWLSILRFVPNFLEHFTIDTDNTRVAVVSYSTRASVDIDGIRSGQYDKCSFVARLQKQMDKKVPSGYSATYDALLRAKNVALTARANSKKAVIVITGGRSNIGPPPIRASIQLRSLTWYHSWNVISNGPQLQVYAFGIKDAYVPEVRSIASSLPNHTLYIPTFQAFRKLARSLHNDSQSESWHVLSDSGHCHGICHQEAYCACGTRTGQYLCICRNGYQGDGTTCTVCPKGTYKSRISPSQCVLCPSNSTTLVEGATEVKQCVCQPPLYQNAPGYPCQPRHCEDLPNIEHGYKFHVPGKVTDELPDTGRPCQNLPESSCHYICDHGYRLDGQPGLVCLPNGSWEGTVPSCRIVDCGPLSDHHQEPTHASVDYLNQTTTFGNLVLVRCNRGWRTFGDLFRRCTHTGVWSGTQTWCVEGQCPALTLSPGLIMMPATCGKATQLPGTVCQYLCEPGYELIGPLQVECTDQGTWNASTPAECVDREPPSITCANDFTTNVTTANFAVIHWKSYPPEVTDNSGEFTLTTIGVNESINSLRLTAGFHRIKYIARDKTGNEAFCVQQITVRNFTVHLVTCPDVDVSVNMTNHQQQAIWPEVIFADHNNETVAHKCVPTNNTLLPPGVYTVTCVPDTQTYQQTYCQFRAIFRQPRCEIPPPPLHGNVSCTPTSTSLMTCVPHCQEGYDFFYVPQSTFVCDLDGNWILQKSGTFWPDCSRKYSIRKALLQGNVKYHYYGDQCENISDEIASTFTEFLESKTWNICELERCSFERVHVYCGRRSIRKRRSIRHRVLAGGEVSSSAPIKNQANTVSFINLLLEKGVKSQEKHPSEALSQEKQPSEASSQEKQPSEALSQEKQPSEASSQEKQPSEASSQEKQPSEASSQNNFYEAALPFHPKHQYQSLTTSNEPQSQTITNRNERYIGNQDKVSNNHKSFEENVITRYLYQTKNGKIKNKSLVDGTRADKLQNQEFARSTSFDSRKKTTWSFANSAKVAPKISEKLLNPNTASREVDVPLEQDIPQNDNINLILHKRSAQGVTLDSDFYSDADHVHDIDSSAPNSTPSIDYFMENVTPRIDVDEDSDEVRIDFRIRMEIFNDTVNEIQQAQMLVYMMDIFNRLNSSLSQNDLTLDDINATDITDDRYILHAFSHEMESPSLDECDFGYVTRSGYMMASHICVACPSGSRYDENMNQCIQCLVAYYQPEETQSECLKCPYDTMTQYPGAHNISMCLEMCNAGEFSGTGLAPCESCPLHSYQPLSSATTCLPCPMDRKTLRTGAVHAIECLDLCNPGMFSETGLVPCMPCPVGSYQPNHGAFECLLCEDGLTTHTDHASNISECFAWDACSNTELRCGETSGQCVVENNVATCVCELGFSGTSCEINISDCFGSSCQNNGTCIDGINTFTCDCLPGFTGTKCEVNIDECQSSPCQHGSSCLDLFNGYQCYCLHEYTGVHCQTRIPLCDGIACINGQCVERNSEAFCECNQGFAGITCNMTFDLCSSHPCINSDRCVSTSGNFECHCHPGFTGALCETALDPCENSNCSRDSLCIPLSGQFDYLCKCPGGRSGIFCDYGMIPHFDLVFNTDSPDGQYVVFPPEYMPSLVDFTVCTWLRPQSLSTFATIVAFTIPLPQQTIEDSDNNISRESKEFETVFSLKQTDKLIVNIFNHSIFTNVTLTFLVWSHLCVTWSCTSNHWQVVVNGSLSAEGILEHQCSSLPPHVQVVLGQNNPFYAETSMLWNVFVGEISQFNIFSHVLSLDDLRGLASGRTCNTTFGDVVSWTDATAFIKGNLMIQLISHCLDINECWFPAEFPCGNNRGCSDFNGSYNCSSCINGYTGDVCEIPDDDCALNQCDRGECIDGPEPYDFQCICPPGYTGYLCEVMINLCSSAPCQNGGTCISMLNSYNCSCPMRHMGPHCERPASICLPNPCQNNGICIEMNADNFHCSCSENFTGRICERRKHWCDDNVCRNGGICQNHSLSQQNNVISPSQNDGFCQCENGWIGQHCEVRMVLSCDLFPCVNGGSCLPLPESQQGYRCQCLNSSNIKVDENCEYLNPCDLSPCPNNTLCIHLPNYTYLCLCIDANFCRSYNQSASDHSQIFPPATDKITTSTSDTNLNSAEIWVITTITGIIVLLIIPFAFYMLWRRKCNRPHGEILIMSDVDSGHLTNPGFHSEDLQLEESIYADLGDDCPLQEDNRTVKDLGSEQRNKNQESIGCYMSSSSSGSFSSFHSAMSKKPSKSDDTDTPLLSDDYLEPGVPRMATSQNQKLEKPVSMKSKNNMLPKLGVSNEGFDSGDYVISDNKQFKQNNGKIKSNLISKDKISESDKVCYENGNVLHNESVLGSNFRESKSKDIMPIASSESSGK